MFDEWREDELGFIQLIARFNRRVLTIGFCLVLAVLAAIAYLVVSESRYTAEATLILVSDANRRLNADNLHIELETHAKLIRSDAVIEKVLRQLETDTKNGIASNNNKAIEFIDGVLGYLSFLSPGETGSSTSSNIDGEDSAVQNELILAAVPAVRRNLSSARDGQSMLLKVSFTSSDPVKAVEVANSFARIYTNSKWSRQPVQVTVLGREIGSDLSRSAPNDPNFPVEQVSNWRNVLEVVSLATLPTVTRTPNEGLVLSVFGMIGLLAGIALVIRKEWEHLK